MSDASRKAFEEFVERQAEAHNYMHMPSLLSRLVDSPDSYATTWVEMMWSGWQARQAEIDALKAEIADLREALGELTV